MHLPIVAADVIGPREVIKDGLNGFLVPACTVEPLRDALGKLIEDPEIRQRFGQTGFDIVTQRYRQHIVWDGILAEYRKAMKNT